MPHFFENALSQIGENNKFFDLRKISSSPADQEKIAKLPLSIKLLLEMTMRKCDGTDAGSRPADVSNIVNWKETQGKVEVSFWPARVLMQDFSGVPAVADLAAMRDAVTEKISGDEETARDLVNPLIPIDLVIDHSINAVKSGSRSALKINEQVEMEQNAERFELLRWASKSFRNFRVVPPGSGIVHQINLEVLARVAFSVPQNSILNSSSNKNDNNNSILYPDTLVGTDSHTTMVNGIGCLGWGVGGLEAESAALGEPIQMLLPPVVGVRIYGALPAICSATDIVLYVVSLLRKASVVGQFVEFFGEGVQAMSAADRATISNMCPEYGATCGLFGVDDVTLEYLIQTGRKMDEVNKIGTYFQSAFGFHNPEEATYSRVLELDLATVTPSLAGPKRPHDLIPLSNLKNDFNQCLTAPLPGHKSFAVASKTSKKGVSAPQPISPPNSLFYTSPTGDGKKYPVDHGMVVLAAITSCTNTSNPEVMIGAGLLARNARRAGLTSVKPYVKTSLSPGSRVVTEYLQNSGLLQDLEALGFYIAGYGCMTCIGNSGPLLDGVSDFVRSNKLVASAVLSGNRNFEGRVHPDTIANYLASPPLVVAAALAGTVNIDYETEPIGISENDGNKPVFLKDIWPAKDQIREIMQQFVTREAFEGVYAGGSKDALVWQGNDVWRQSLGDNNNNNQQNAASAIPARFPWKSQSTYIQPPPFFNVSSSETTAITNARCLLYFGDSVTTDHISPAGSIATSSDAGSFLQQHGVNIKNFNSYGSRRGNDLIMRRGTFANVRLSNRLVNPQGGPTGPRTVHFPSGDVMSVFEASERYKKEGGAPLVILAGKEYGSGSSRDWAAKGPALLGVRVVIAESYERIHRSNLVGMGVLPLQFVPGDSASKLGLTGKEVFTVSKSSNNNEFIVSTDTGITFKTLSRVDTVAEQKYMTTGGILPFVVSKLVQRGTQGIQGQGKL